MDLLHIFTTIGFLFGAVLTVTLLRLMVEQGIRRRAELPFLALSAASSLFYASAFLSVFLGLLFREGPVFLQRGLDSTALVTLSLQPSLLMHTFLAGAMPGSLPNWLRVLLYVPALTGIPTIASPEGGLLRTLTIHGGPLFTWYLLAVVISAGIAWKPPARLEGAEASGFIRDSGRALWPLLVAILVAFPLGGRFLQGPGEFLVLSVLLAPVVPSLVFAYYIYRFSYLGVVVKNGLINSLLAFFLLAFYIFGVRQFGESLLADTAVNAHVLEGMMIMALVFTFGSLQAASQEFYDKYLLRTNFKKRQAFAQMSRDLASPVAVAADPLLAQIASGIARALSAEWAGIFLVESDGSLSAGSETPTALDLPTLIEPFRAGRKTALERDQLDEGALKEAFQKGQVWTVVPVVTAGGLQGLACLGRRPYNRPLSLEELDMLGLLLNQLRATTDKLNLFQQKISLERKLLEDERLASLGMLAASVAHEIKNPLGSMKAILQVTQESLPEEDLRREDIAVVLEEIDRLANTVGRLLEYIRPGEEPGRYVAVEKVVERVLEIFSYETRRHQIGLVTRLAPEPHYIKGSLEALKSILFNLVMNGIQAMESGGTLTVSTRSRGRGAVVIEIADTGPGIPPEKREKIFEPFATFEKEGGTGLGLPLVRQRLEELGGAITVASDSSGTCFRVELPIYRPSVAQLRLV